MFTLITLTLAKIGDLFNSTGSRSSLDRFIASRNPSNAAEVDYYIREYDRKYARNGGFV